MRKGINDVLFGLSLIGLAVLIVVRASDFPRISAEAMGGGLGPAFYPRLASFVLMGLAILMIASAIAQMGKESRGHFQAASSRTAAGHYRRYVTPLAFLVLLAAYGLAMSLFGFKFSTFVFLATCILALGRNEWWGHRGRIVAFLFIALFAMLGIYGLFQQVAKVPLPTGTVWGGR